MPINTSSSYIEIGTGWNGSSLTGSILQLPVPVELPVSDEFLVEANRNANGSLVFQQIGRNMAKLNIKWGRLKNTIWWEINRWFEDNGYIFYMKYFNHNTGKVIATRFYRGDFVPGTPSTSMEILNGEKVPTHYFDCGFSLIDAGWGSKSSIVVKSINIG